MNKATTREELFHENLKLRAALEFYANPETYQPVPVVRGYGWYTASGRDNGETARKALGIKEEED